ncbi:hypothetical protein ACFOZY_09870 [Chungangia koreensis]|uniref:Beta-carotene 15,15'-monooxygenase n=1 Tax=Chungangia koreensis TaxID=752657 RepID=A0ABV8X995_9LACT
MVALKDRNYKPLLLSILTLVITSNILLYRSPLSSWILTPETSGVVIGSLIDFSIIVPFLILALTRNKGFTLKRFVTWMVIGIIAARFIIPMDYFKPFTFIPYVAIAAEALLVLAEIGLIFLLVRRLPAIITATKQHDLGALFAFPQVVEEKVRSHPLIKIVAAEGLMLYYAFGSWKQTAPNGEDVLTLHKKTSMVAFYVMLIHAIVIETIGFHWWLHEKSLVLSLVLLILNVYSVVYILGDIQAVRLNPMIVRDGKLHVSLGLGKRMTIPVEAIDSIDWGKDAENVNLKDKNLIAFMAQDFETPKPDCVIHLKESLEATLFMGMRKSYGKVALKVDDPNQLKRLLI